MTIALVRFFAKGWIETFYLKPDFFFSYDGLEWITPLAPPFMYGLYAALLVLSVCIMAGLFFRISIVLFFLLFSYTEFLDKSVYLNHYYLISLLSFLMSFLPMSAVASLDALRQKSISVWNSGPAVFLLKIQVGSVYFFGGVAKIGYDWLILGQPLGIWLSSNSHLPLIGQFLSMPGLAIAISWLAMMFDLSAPFLLYFRRTRPWIYPVLLIFHIFTAILFPIGMFPWFMSAFALVFFSSEWHRKVMTRLFRSHRFNSSGFRFKTGFQPSFFILIPFFLAQLLMPFRAWLYPGNPLWHEQGFRFSWRIMLMEKNGSLEYQVKVKESGRQFVAKPSDFLTRRQVVQASFQPDMVLQFAHFLHDYYLKTGIGDTEIRAICYVSLNGKSSRLLVDPTVDLATQKRGWKNKEWVLSSEF